MPKKFKVKINDGVTVYSNEIPDDVEELELDCRTIGEKALANRDDLRSVTLINTEVIDRNAFFGCSHLQEVRLPDTVRVIGDHAFANTNVWHLVIPRGVTELGTDIINKLINNDHERFPVLEIYLKDGKLPFLDRGFHYIWDTRIIARSSESGEILYQYISLNYLENIFTEYGADFTEYDKRLENYKFEYPFSLFHSEYEAIYTRIHNPAGMSEEVLGRLKAHFSELSGDRLEAMIKNDHETERFIDYPYYDDTGCEEIIKLISLSMAEYKHETAKILLRVLSGKLGGAADTGGDELMEMTDHSVRLGLTEVTALLMQKLHERGGGDLPDLEL